MKITAIDFEPLRIPYKTTFHWSQGVIEAAEVILISVRTDEGISGFGESMNSAAAPAVISLLAEVAKTCIGKDPSRISEIVNGAYTHLFAARGTCSAPRYGALVLTGLELALWDLAGRATGRAVHQLLGGAVRDYLQYIGFPQGETAEALAADAMRWVDQGCDVIYVKIGRGEQLDLDIARQVREAIGSRRLRLDANEAWDVLTARRMIRSLAEFDPEFIEQPTPSDSLPALAQVRRSSTVPVAVDQAVFTPEDVYSVCQSQAADLVVLGLHETGGIARMLKAAAIAEAAGINVCLHGLYETGITTCASNQVGAVISNLDDGNQYMNHLLVEDIIEKPILELRHGRLPVLPGPGLGFELDFDAVARARESYRVHHLET